MHKLLLLFSTDLALHACTSNDSSQTKTGASSQTIHTNAPGTIVTGTKPVVLNGCHQMTLIQDKATLHLHVTNSTVTGNLHYDRELKDDNTGILKGVLRDGFIYAGYTFESERLTSVREVIF